MDDAGSVSAKGGVEPSSKARWMRISVTDLTDGRQKVYIRLPVSLVEIGVMMGAQYLPGASEAELLGLLSSVREGKLGRVAQIDDSDNGERVEVFVE